MPDTVYLTPAEWQAMAQGIDFSGLTDADMEALIARASVLAEAYGTKWLATDYENEQHPWRSSHRCYLYHWPVIEIDEVRIRVGVSTNAVFQGSEIYINQTGRYIEVSSIALAFGIAPSVVNLGLSEPQIEVDYTAGYATIPVEIKEAVAMIASAQYLARNLFEEGMAGVVSFTIGSYQVSFGTKEVGGVAGFGNFIPEPAKMILSKFTGVSVR